MTDFFIPKDLRPLPGVRVSLEHDIVFRLITVKFIYWDEVLVERTYDISAWTEHAYACQLAIATERHTDTCRDQSESESSSARRRETTALRKLNNLPF